LTSLLEFAVADAEADGNACNLLLLRMEAGRTPRFGCLNI
jgi:hypothetical protein